MDRPIDLELTASRFNRRSLLGPEMRAFFEAQGVPCPGDSVWDIEALALAALHFHPDLEVARTHWQAEEAAFRQAAQRPNPEIDAAPAFNTTSTGVSPWVVPVSLRVPIETAGRRGARLRAARARARSAWWSYASRAWQIRRSVQEAYLDVVEARQTLGLLGAAKAADDAIVEVIASRVRVGDLPPTELSRARSADRETALAWVRAGAEEKRAMAHLAASVGVPLQALAAIRMETSVDGWHPTVTGSLMVRRALTQRPDLLATLSDYEAAQGALQLAVARQYPNLNLGPGYEFDQGDNKWAFGLGLVLPLLHRNQGEIAAAAAKRKEAAARVLASQAKVAGDIELAIAGYRGRVRQVVEAESLLATAEDQEARTLRMQRAGELTRLEVLLAKRETSRIRQQLLAARMQRLRAAVAVEHAVQMPDRMSSLPSTYPQESSATKRMP